MQNKKVRHCLELAIMNIRLPENRRAMSGDNTIYKMGHRDARHAAALLAAEHEETQYALLEALETLLDVAKRVPGYSNQCDQAREAISKAYGESRN